MGVALALVGVTWAWQKLALLAMAMPTRSRPQGQGHAHKDLVLFGTQKADSRSIDAKIHYNHTKNLVGVALIRGRGSNKWAW